MLRERCTSVRHVLLAALLLAAPSITQSQGWTTHLPVSAYGFGGAVYDQTRQRFLLGGNREWDGTTLAESGARIPGVLPLLTYDIARRVVVSFGSDAEVNNDTHTFDGVTWTLRQPARRPAARFGSAVAYDAARQRVVLFGGGSNPHLGDTWEWDGTNWTELKPASSPAARTSHSMAYDPIAKRVVLYGGRTSAGLMSDTWEWDGTNWSMKTTTTSPNLFENAVMTFDPRKAEILLFGRSLSATSQELWSYKAGVWTRYAPNLQPNPAWRALGYDQRRRQITLFGHTPSIGFTIWEWDGTNWSVRRPPGAVVEPTTAPGHTFDSVRRTHVIFGGMAPTGGVLDDTCELAGTVWTKPATPTRPAGRMATALSYDLVRKRTILFGGRLITTAAPMADTWEWDGVTWARKTPSRSPTGVADHAMVYDNARRRTVLFGGYTSLGTNQVPPTPSDNTWEYDGSNWTQVMTTIKPPARGEFGMAFDAIRQRVVVFGGCDGTTYLADTWEFDGSTWRQASPVAVPSPRSRCTMTYDPSRGRVVLHGGKGGTPTNYIWLSDTWEYDGSNWSRIQTSGADVKDDLTMAYDTRASSIVMIGRFGTLHRLGTQPSIVRNGTGCSSTAAKPTLTANAPSIGTERLSYDVLSSLANAPCIYGISPLTQNLGLGSGCTLYVGSPLLTFGAVTNNAGFAELAFPLPFDPTLRGVSYHTQAFVLDPASPVLGLAFTNAVQTVIGN
ncbi:MAG: hypothetical protein KDC95_12395 [Planctomycetes bacterium]|nr:hypothetical protein [Planctomycetota bacterium]